MSGQNALIFYTASVVFGGLAFRLCRRSHKSFCLSVISIACIFGTFFYSSPLWVPGGYLLAVAIQVEMVRRFARCDDWRYWVSFSLPILMLIAYKILAWNQRIGFELVGVSYLSFRMAYLAFELNGEPLTPTGYFDLISHTIFFPSFIVGPITHFANYISSTESPVPLNLVPRSIYRSLTGVFKFGVAAPIVQQFGSVGNMDLNSPLGLMIVLPANLVYVYLNFSGFCDLAVGVGCLIGVQVIENFNRPFSQCNLRDFWNHWHISLTIFMRDVLYTPLVMRLLRSFPSLNIHLAGTLVACLSFFLVGIWHGNGINFIALGVLYGLGMSFVISGPDLLRFFKPIIVRDSWYLGFRRFISWVVTMSFMSICVTLMLMSERQVDKLLQLILKGGY